MEANHRRTQIISALKNATTPVSASSLAELFSVSRQVIVGDIALIRASGISIYATPRGYLFEAKKGADCDKFGYLGTIACKHDGSQVIEELYTIVDFGGTIVDITVEHGLYGQISGVLNISSRFEADVFSRSLASNNDKPLSSLTDGLHLHTIGCPSREIFLHIKEALDRKGILYS